MFAFWSEEGIVSVFSERASLCSSVGYEFAIFLQVFCFSKLLGIKIKGMSYRSQYLFNTDLLDLIKISNFLWQTYSFIIFWLLFLVTIILIQRFRTVMDSLMNNTSLCIWNLLCLVLIYYIWSVSVLIF